MNLFTDRTPSGNNREAAKNLPWRGRCCTWQKPSVSAPIDARLDDVWFGAERTENFIGGLRGTIERKSGGAVGSCDVLRDSHNVQC